MHIYIYIYIFVCVCEFVNNIQEKGKYAKCGCFFDQVALFRTLGLFK